ncbi:unnamed protein product [Linum trigynum]|uniref:Uncharacterized protein n=1 Tax=Linum trigynum TaxID=586398 RepID=A0AAV2D0R0_9ROSI
MLLLRQPDQSKGQILPHHCGPVLRARISGFIALEEAIASLFSLRTDKLSTPNLTMLSRLSSEESDKRMTADQAFTME